MYTIQNIFTYATNLYVLIEQCRVNSSGYQTKYCCVNSVLHCPISESEYIQPLQLVLTLLLFTNYITMLIPSKLLKCTEPLGGAINPLLNTPNH